ncbi:MAG: conjugal transfer protein TraG N-terminal domain-containing protein, partial [Pseudomonadota bacterium]
MMEIFTIGGGEYLVNIFNAVSAWTGGGGFRALLRVVMVIGLIYTLLIVAFSLDWRAWFNWFLGATLIYGALVVPVTSVRITDRLNPSLAPATVANVPIGLAMVASVSSQAGDWLTRTAETVFVMPGALQMSTNGMIYGARLWDRTRDFQIRDPRISANLGEYFKQCLLYDILLGHTSFDTIANSNNILADMGPGSPARGMKFLPASGPPIIVTCQNAYNELQTGITAYTELGLQQEGRKLFPGLTPALARAKLVSDLPVIANQFHGSSQTAQQVFQQRSLVNAFLEARANLGAADGDTFAMLRAEEQARNTYSSIAQQAMTWVPLLNIVLTVVFYAMFPVIFPLFLMPRTGTMALKGYFTGFFYLAAWGPLYVVLHMFIMDRASDALNATAPGGITMAGMAGIDAVNADTATIAGFLMMSIPFLAGGMAKGAVRRQNIWHRSRRKLAECGPRLLLGFRRRAYGVASADVQWSVA